MLDRLQENFAELLAKWECQLVEFGGESDHVHLQIEAHPELLTTKQIRMNILFTRYIFH